MAEGEKKKNIYMKGLSWNKGQEKLSDSLIGNSEGNIEIRGKDNMGTAKSWDFFPPDEEGQQVENLGSTVSRKKNNSSVFLVLCPLRESLQLWRAPRPATAWLKCSQGGQWPPSSWPTRKACTALDFLSFKSFSQPQFSDIFVKIRF